jgi:hypothetical protein
MPGWMSRAEALAYFDLGADVAELERIILEHDIDADVDELGRILEVDAEHAKAALFAEHERKVGYRPDDPGAMARERKKARDREDAARRRRRAKRERLAARVKARGSLTEG